jgi:Tol biopolymer transport system component
VLQPGDRIGPLRIERALGAGGMGEVWLARDERLERLVAVKLLPAESRLDPAARGRMLREARAASGLKHPGIVTVHDIGDHEGLAYIVLEYVEGETFDALVKRRGPLPAAEAVELVAQVGDAVAVAHAAGILHRDLKAQNLMVDGAGRVKVLDFGLSKRTDTTSLSGDHGPTSSTSRDIGVDESAATAATVVPDAATTPAPGVISQIGSNSRTDEPLTEYGVRMGTPGWASPELMNGGLSDVRSDVFALGAVLYHLLTGAMPFPAKTWGELRDQIENGPPPPSATVSSIPRALDDVVLSALAARPERRPTSARELIEAARNAVEPRRSRARLLVGAGAAAAVGVAALVIAGGGVGGKRTHGAAAPVTVVTDAAVDAPPAPVEPRQLTSLGGCAYLPAFLDEDTLSFDLTRDGNVDLYTVDIGGQPVRRTDAPGWEWRSSRADDGKAILFLELAADGSFASRYDLAAGSITRLFTTIGPIAQAGDTYFHAPDPGNVLRRRSDNRDEEFLNLTGVAIDSIVVSPDRSKLALLTFGGNQLAKVCVTPVARPEIRCYSSMTGSSRPAWSSSGDAVYVDGKMAINRVSLATDEAAIAVPDVVATGGITISPSGRRMVYSDCLTRGQLVDVTAAAPHKPIVDEMEASSPAFGPGGQLAYVGRTKNIHRVMVREQGGTFREVSRHNEARITGLAFSPDGQQLAYVVGSRTEPGIYAVRLDSSAVPNRLTDQDSDADPLFVAGELVFTRIAKDGAPRLMRVSLDGSVLEEASTRPRRTIAVDHGRGRVLLASPAHDFLYWWDPASGKETPGPVVERPNGGIHVSPDGRWLMALVGSGGGTIQRMRLDRASKLEVIHRLPGDLTSGTGAIDDSGRVLITLYRWAGELWLVDAPDGSRW